MSRKPDPAPIVAEALAGLLVAGGTAAATAAGTPVVLIGMGTAVVNGVFKYLIAHMSPASDPKDILQRIRNDRTACTVDTIRDALVEAMGLKPEFTEPIEELADAVQAKEDGRDEDRFQKALLALFTSVTETTAVLKDVKDDTGVIREDVAALRSDVQEVKAAVTQRQGSGAGDNRPDRFLALRVECLTADLRNLLDADGKAKWDAISKALGEHSWAEAFTLAKEMEAWLEAQADKISIDVKIQGLLTLADVALIRDSGFPFEDRPNVDDALRLLEKAEAAASSEISEESGNRLLRVRAKLTYIQGDHDRAREILEPMSDPGAVSLKLGMLEEEARWTDASDLAESQTEPHKKWAASAVAAHVQADRLERAEAVVQWAESQELGTSKSCVLAYVKSRYTAIVGEGMGRSLHSLTDDDIETLKSLQSAVENTFASALTEGPKNGLDAEALEMAILLGHVLGKTDECQRAIRQLVKWTPVSPEVGRAVLRGDTQPIDSLADRYLDEHEGVFLTTMLAAMLLIDFEAQAERAMALLLQALDDATPQQQEEIATTILIGAQYCEPDIVADAYRKVAELLTAEHRLSIMLQAVQLAKEHQVGDAKLLVEKVSDSNDHIWLQLAASFAAQQSAWEEVAEYMRQLSELTDHVEAYRQESEAWLRADRISESIAPLETVHARLPDDLGVARNLAMAYHRVERYSDAVPLYGTLWAAGPRTSALALNYTNALVLSGDVPHATSILTEYVNDRGPEVEVLPLLACAHLLHTQDDPAGAVAILKPHWERFKSDHRYLMALLQLGHAANQEGDAHAAFEELAGMLNRGELPEHVMWKCSIDDIKQHIQDSQQRRKFVNEQYRTGRLPWLIASNWIQPTNHAYVSWLVRTQPAVYSDHPDVLAEHSLYSTNSFTAVHSDKSRILDRIVAPPKGSTIVADMSALITLHRLGMLDTGLEHFAKVYLPQSYRAIWVEEHAKIPHHQPSQIQSRQAILDAIADARIGVAGDGQASIPCLDEYERNASGESSVLRIRQLADWLATKGRLTGQQLASVHARCKQPSLLEDADAYRALDAGSVVAKPFTLQTLHDLDLLDVVCQGIRVSIEPDDLNALTVELRNQRLCDDAGQWYRDLVNRIGRRTNVDFVPLPTDTSEGQQPQDEDEDAGAHGAIHFGLDAALLAMHLNQPLLADDRYCQQGALNHRKDRLDVAFGTDSLLAVLEADGKLSGSGHAEHLLQLIRWRYKFLVPSAATLREMAFRFIDGVPGADLRDVAVYMQDCMRDIGLYGGPEQVDPPMPMALKLFKVWIDAVADFIVSLWWDDRFTEEQAARLSRWASRFLLPAWPRNIAAGSWRRLADVRRYSMLGGLLVHLVQKEDTQKGNRVLNRVRRSIAITDDELASAAESAGNAMLAMVPDQDDATRRGVFLHVLKIVYGNRNEIPWRLLPAARCAGVITPEDMPAAASAEDVAVLRSRDHQKRMEPTIGPFAYIQEQDGHVAATYLPEALCAHQAGIREAALDNLLVDEFCPKSEVTRRALEAASEDIRADEVDRWVPAVAGVLEPLQEDFALNIAGFRQSQQRHHDDGSAKCWSHLIRPTAEALLAIDQDGWRVLGLGDDTEPTVTSICDAYTNVEDLLAAYDNVAGHMTLAAPLDLGTQIKRLLHRTGADVDAWAFAEAWLKDCRRPWRQYHACQALLVNPDLIPKASWEEFCNHVAKIVGLICGERNDSDEAQVWKLEADLAANYLRTIDLGGYGLEASRPLTAAWWAAREVVEMLLSQMIPTDKVPSTIRKWRKDPILRGTLITYEAWAWIGAKEYSPGRFAALGQTAPRSAALLRSVGQYVRANGLGAVPDDVRNVLRDSYCTALALGDIAAPAGRTSIWAWDSSLIDAAETFYDALPEEERTDAVDQTMALGKRMVDPLSLKEALELLPKTSGNEGVLLCAAIRLHCYRNPEAGDVMRPFVVDGEWRERCAKQMSELSADMLAQGLFVLQTRGGSDWQLDVPYIFLRMAEATDDADRATAFLAYLVMSSAAGNTGGALKSLGDRRHMPRVREGMRRVKTRIDDLAGVVEPAVRLRMQGILSLCDGWGTD